MLILGGSLVSVYENGVLFEDAILKGDGSLAVKNKEENSGLGLLTEKHFSYNDQARFEVCLQCHGGVIQDSKCLKCGESATKK